MKLRAKEIREKLFKKKIENESRRKSELEVFEYETMPEVLGRTPPRRKRRPFNFIIYDKSYTEIYKFIKY